MVIFFIFSIVYCQNIIKNPSFEEFDSNHKLLYWSLAEEADLSSDSHSGQKSLHWKPKNKLVFNCQVIPFEEGFPYEICAYIKTIKAPDHGLLFCIESTNKTKGIFQFSYSRGYYGDLDWKQVCFMTDIIRKPNKNDIFYLGLFTIASPEEGEIFVDDVSAKRINFAIGINNDRDEVYDIIYVTYQINGNKENYNLTDFDLTTKIIDKNKKYYEKK